MVAGFVVGYVRSRGIQYLPRFMRVSRSLVAVALCFVFLAGIGCVSFRLAVFAKELLLIGSAFLGGVAFPVASVACLYASALAPFTESIVRIDHHGLRTNRAQHCLTSVIIRELVFPS